MEIVISVVAKVAGYLVAPIIHPFTYCCSYKTNFQKLKNEFEKLKIDKDCVQYRVDDSRIKGDGIQKHVEEWLSRVDEIINEVGTLIEDREKSNNRCLKGLCPNMKTRYQLSKKAERETNAIVGLHEKGKFDSVSFRTIPEETWLKSAQGFMHFESRESTLKEILDALSNRNFNMIGVYGMGGVGKTTLVKEVGRQAKANNLFDKVISAHVSQTPQIKKIQREIAEKLGLQLNEKSEDVRAGRLLERLKKETKILVILDDIWERLGLEAIGIPSADDNSGCKVLLTARRQDVLSSMMDYQQIFFVDVLNEKEAWSLFKETAGECIENGELNSIATDMVKECAGLPIAIVPVAMALKNKRLFEWKDALLELRRPSLRNFSGTTEMAYKSIELSYNHLNGEELKSTFLLIGYSSISRVEDVSCHGMGLGLFQNINTLEEARDRAHTLVDRLKKSCLLLDGDKSEGFSMHDVVRDAAISIASRDQHVFVVHIEVVTQINWPNKERLKVCSAISLLKVRSAISRYKSKIDKLPQGLECPQLKYFRIVNDTHLRIPDNFFTGMPELRVLDFTNMNLLSWSPSSLGLLQNLQTLSLDYCKQGDIATIGDLKKLEILRLRHSAMEKLVAELGQLAQLRLLNLSRCYGLKVIPPKVISRLSRLEELYIGESPIEWGKVEGVDRERRNANLHELTHLSKLTSLEILIQDEKTLPRDLSFFKMLQRYRISIGYQGPDDPSDGISRKFKLKLTSGANICLNQGNIMQLKGIEDLSLDGLLDMKNVLYKSGREGFPQLKRLQIRDNGNIFCVVDTVDCATARTAFPVLESLYLADLSNLEKICRGPPAAEFFCKLRNIRVENCDNLKSVFPLVIGRGLQQLQSIEVKDCQNMEVIFAAESGDESSNNNTQAIELTQLRELELRSLPQLTSFCTGDLHFEKVFPNLEDLSIDEKHIGLFEDDLLCKLKCLDVWFDESTTILSLDDFLQRFHYIKTLCIDGNNVVWLKQIQIVENGMKATIRGINQCRDLKQILKRESSNTNNFEKLEISACEILINLVPSSTSFQNLTDLKVTSCNGIANVLTSSTAKSLVRLKRMAIRSCSMITEIVADDDDEGDNYAAKDEIFFSELKELELWDLIILTSFCSGNKWAFKFPSLETLLVGNCPHMNIFIGGELSTPKLLKVQLNGNDKECVTLDGDLNTTIQNLYLKRKGLTIRANTRLNEGHIMQLKRFEDLSLDGLLDMKNVLPELGREGFPQLKSLQIRNNGNLFCVVDTMDCAAARRAFPLLESLCLDDLSNLEKICRGPPVVELFCKLKNVRVRWCDKMKDVFPLVIGRRLQQLQSIEVSSCQNMEVIFAAESGDESSKNNTQAIELTQLRTLKLRSLPRLSSFCTGDLHFEFPSLEQLTMRRCPDQFMVKFKSTIHDFTEKIFPNLKDLSIGEKHIGLFEDDLLCKLKRLDVWLDESTTILSLDDFLHRFHTVKTLLLIRGDDFVSKNLFETVENGMKAIIRGINQCHDLKQILKQESSDTNNLEKLHILRCDNLINLVPSSTSFQNLTDLWVAGCNGMINVLTSSTAKSLVRLKQMKIYFCRMITEIVADDDEEGDNYAVKDEIIFSDLKELVLWNLTALTSFCSGNKCAFKFPSLETLMVDNCPNMNIFSEGELSKLHKVQLDMNDEECGTWEHDLNMTIQHLYLQTKEE